MPLYLKEFQNLSYIYNTLYNLIVEVQMNQVPNAELFSFW